jgi:SCY1-like protein 2
MPFKHTSSHIVLNLEQFQRFMDVIRKLGDRVEKEHNQFLRDSQRIGGRSTETNGHEGSKSLATNLNFESLVGGANGAAAIKADHAAAMAKGWDEDWDSMFTSDEGVRTNRFFSLFFVSLSDRLPQTLSHLPH